VGCALAAGLAVVILFNRLVGLRNAVAEAWSGIDVQLRRRHELSENLLTVTDSFVRHERTVLTRATETRAQAAAVQRSAADVAETENALSRALIQVLATAEAYPELTSGDIFARLQSELSSLEDDLQYARRYYNGTVRNLNNAIQIFPSSLVARLFRFRTAEFFEVDSPDERLAPAV